MKINSYEIQLIPNYGNDKIIINEVKKMGIKTSGRTTKSGFIGCDVPVILKIQCTEKDIKKLKKILKPLVTDSFGISKKCLACGSIRSV